MSTDADDNGDMVKLNVKVPKRLLEEIDETRTLQQGGRCPRTRPENASASTRTEA